MSDTESRTYVKRKRAGLCPRCGLTPRKSSTRTVYCSKCVERLSKHFKAKRRGKFVSSGHSTEVR